MVVTTPPTRLQLSEKPEVHIDNLVYQKIMHWVLKGDFHECSGLGKIAVIDGKARVIDAIMLPQKNSFGSTDIEPADVCKAMYELRDTPGELRFWWHSHANMDVFWSATDRETIKDIAQGGWCIASVFNKRSEVRTAVCLSQPLPLFIDEVTLEIHSELSEDLVQKWDEEFDRCAKRKVSEPVPFLSSVRTGSEDAARATHRKITNGAVKPTWRYVNAGILGDWVKISDYQWEWLEGPELIEWKQLVAEFGEDKVAGLLDSETDEEYLLRLGLNGGFNGH